MMYIYICLVSVHFVFLSLPFVPEVNYLVKMISHDHLA